MFVSLSLFALLLFVVVVAIKWGPLKAGPVALGVMLGLTGAGTPMGPPAVQAIDTVANTIVAGFAAFGGGGHTEGSTDTPSAPETDDPNVVVRRGKGGGHR